MKITKSQVDMRICDVYKKATNTETFREFIRNSEDEFGMEHKDLWIMTDDELNEYIDFLDYLWTK